jgi:hypothetical protein
MWSFRGARRTNPESKITMREMQDRAKHFAIAGTMDCPLAAFSRAPEWPPI